MVVLAASVVTKTGKPLVSRQFVDMSRIRIEGLLAAFPKLVGNGKQHTYVETENVRYVYQPMEALYLLLITNKGSNILEDLETLRLLAKLLPEYVHPMDEEGICACAFDLIFAFDEVIAMGYRESITVTQVRQNTAMESHEEKLHKMIIQSKINDTKDVMKRKAMEIDKQKLEKELVRAKDQLRAGPYVPSPTQARSSRLDDDNTPTFSRPEPTAFSKPEQKKGPSRGMQLGKGKKGATDFLDSLRAEGENVDVSKKSRGGPSAHTEAPSAPQRAAEPISITLEENVRAILKNDGNPVEELIIEGTVEVQAESEQDACVRVEVQQGSNSGFSFKTHPNIDKSLYAQRHLLGLKDPERPFPVGSSVVVLKWLLKSQDESAVPLTINAWPSTSGSETYVSMEYDCQTHVELQDVTIAIPLPSLSSGPRITQVDGDTHYEGRRNQLLWTIDLIDDSNRSGALEFVIPASAGGNFLPITVNFTSSQTICNLAVKSVTNAQTEAPVRYSSHTQLKASEYQIV